MKNLLVFALFGALVCSACSAEQSADEQPAAATDQEEAVVDAPVVEAPVADKDAAITVVEESSADAVEEAAEESVPLLLAQADTPAVARDWTYEEGKHFNRLVPTQPTVGGADKVEVAEVFWYGCSHCNDFEPFINSWASKKPANVRFVRIPAMWNELVALHGKLFYTAEVLAKNGKLADPEGFHTAVFTEFHQRRNQMRSEAAIAEVFGRFGVSDDDFRKTWNSFEVAQKLRVAQDLGRRYGVAGVPAVVVNGKYRTGGAEAGSYPKLLEVIDELVAREGVR